ncbi:MAG: phage tail assembly protein [Candidatus Methylomirabilis sp.]|nr:phage tail assembly protein [Deltaproteobacteria bacterium]
MDEIGTNGTTLPSGRVVELREVCGRDMIEARRQAGKGADEVSVSMAFAARAVFQEGRRVPFEDFVAWPWRDIKAVLRFVNGGDEDEAGAPPLGS